MQAKAKIFGLMFCLLGGSVASASTYYELTIVNGSAMPISPTLSYVRDGQAPATAIGSSAAPGFVKLCQTGDNGPRAAELMATSGVTQVVPTQGLIMPGETRVATLEVRDPMEQSLHFEAMYGKTKDVCALGAFGGRELYALQSHAVSELIGRDEVVATGAFTDPYLETGKKPSTVCAQAKDAVSCLRLLSTPAMGHVHFFAGYLPSVLHFLETRYGAEDTQTLVIPTSGAVRFSLKLKH